MVKRPKSLGFDVVGGKRKQPEKRTEERTETHACDLISRKAAIQSLMSNPIGKSIAERYNVIGWLEGLPSAQPERKTGKWMHCDDGSLFWRCSVCAKNVYGSYSEVCSGEYHFCPNCGARMEGVE